MTGNIILQRMTAEIDGDFVVFLIGMRINKPSLYPNSKFLYKFKPCIIESFQVNYTPTGRASFHKAVDGENAPTSMTFNLRLKEVEYWQEGDFDDGNDPKNVYSGKQ